MTGSLEYKMANIFLQLRQRAFRPLHDHFDNAEQLYYSIATVRVLTELGIQDIVVRRYPGPTHEYSFEKCFTKYGLNSIDFNIFPYGYSSDIEERVKPIYLDILKKAIILDGTASLDKGLVEYEANCRNELLKNVSAESMPYVKNVRSFSTGHMFEEAVKRKLTEIHHVSPQTNY